ncbi:hypothetical protein [uncultured Gimesia sp.]|uniref:hypothetical protein n=1 Tax=uncultured Gimesia sp. TaxID=1678688 RepID=UPI0026124A26|nr:hypothetical protein [uncultured Gimesia sp.]
MSLLVRMILIMLAIVSVPGLVFVWLMPIDFFQSWMIERAGPDHYSQFAAHEQASAAIVFLRILLPLIAIFTFAGVYFHARLVKFVTHCKIAVFEQTLIKQEEKQDGNRTLLFRSLLLVWFGLALFHFGKGVERRLEDWPWYHFHSGPSIMPNISESNRDVIRFLKEATDENSRILVLSDQKLFFLSYYLLPRKLFHLIHPESEFVIPKEYQQRQLKAYRLSDLDEAYLARIAPDYILEYYEGDDYLEKERLREDPRWMQFQQSRQGPQYQPTYNIRLHKFQPDTTSSNSPIRVIPQQGVAP